VVAWLLQEDNPGVRLRTLTGLCRLPAEYALVQEARRRVAQTLPAARDLSWMEGKGIQTIYHLAALAEMGLTREDVGVDPVVERLLAQPFDANCADMLALRCLVMLGYASDPRLKQRLLQVSAAQLPDGGWLCLHRTGKMQRIPKSCIKVNMHALLLAAELHARGLTLAGSPALLHYFLKRRLFYCTSDPTRLVLDCAPGGRMIDAFFPSELVRVGLPMLLYALAVLGAGQALELQEAWQRLAEKRDAQGKVKLEGTLPKSYLPKERVGQPGKWVTLYAWLAWENLAVSC
jgi:hypothetical protein